LEREKGYSELKQVFTVKRKCEKRKFTPKKSSGDEISWVKVRHKVKENRQHMEKREKKKEGMKKNEGKRKEKKNKAFHEQGL